MVKPGPWWPLPALDAGSPLARAWNEGPRPILPRSVTIRPDRNPRYRAALIPAVRLRLSPSIAGLGAEDLIGRGAATWNYHQEDWRPHESPPPGLSGIFGEASKSQLWTESRFFEGPNVFGWMIRPVLMGFNDLNLLDPDTEGLRGRMELLIGRFLDARTDRIGEPFFDGRTPAQWGRASKYNVKHQHLFLPYRWLSEGRIKAMHKLQNLRYSDINYSGLILDQMLRYAQSLDKGDPWRSRILEASAETLRSHDEDWIATGPREGYYRFSPGCPYWLDGVEIPFNEAAPFGSCLVRMHLLTGEMGWLERALGMWNRLKGSFRADAAGQLTYPYFIGDGFSGWWPWQSKSRMTPFAFPVHMHERFWKASLTIHFMHLLALVHADVVPYLREFYFTLAATWALVGDSGNWPHALGFHWHRSLRGRCPMLFGGWEGFSPAFGDRRDALVLNLLRSGKEMMALQMLYRSRDIPKTLLDQIRAA